MVRKLMALVVAVFLLTAACGDDDGGADSGAPLGLSGVSMPGDEAAVRSLLAKMPAEIDGNPRGTVPDYDLLLTYGEFNSIVALPMEGADPLAQDLARFELEPGAVVEGSGLDASADLVWVQGSFADEGGAGLVFIMVWGEPVGDWAFNVSAESAETRDAIVEAFVAGLG
jgi:hypothetical protein